MTRPTTLHGPSTPATLPPAAEPQTTEGDEVRVTPTLPSVLTSPPTFWGLFAAFRRRWRLATSLGLIVGAVAAAAAWYVTGSSTYTASTLLRVDSALPRVLSDTKEGRSDFATYQRSQTALIKTR